MTRAPDPQDEERTRLERENAKLRKINRALMGRVERSMDYQGNAFALFQAAIGLENKVRERTAALLNALEDLEAAKAAEEAARVDAEQANRSKTRFLAAIGHDLLQPLNAARVFASALAERRLSPENRHLAHSALIALDSVDEMLAALLDISKLDAGVQPVEISDFHLSDLFAHLAEETRIVAARKSLGLRILPCSKPVRSDPHLLGRIVRNYLGNAVRYTAPGGRVLVGCRRHEAGLLVGVWDTGIGIDPGKLEEIFEEFHRLDAGEAGGGKGMGLGLAIVKRIARMLDHPLIVESRPGRGSMFGVVVPLADAGAVADAAPAPVSAPRRLAGVRVVVIDDEAETRDALRALLENWGCETIVVPSGEAAQAALVGASGRPEAIVADFHLGGGEKGPDAIARVRASCGTDIPAVVISGDSDAAIRARVRDAGHAFLRKPIRPGKLRSLLEHMVPGTLR